MCPIRNVKKSMVGIKKWHQMNWNILICNKRKIFNIFNTFSSENLLKIQSKVGSKTHIYTHTHTATQSIWCLVKMTSWQE